MTSSEVETPEPSVSARLDPPRSLLANPIIAVLRAGHARSYDRVVETLARGGIDSFEFTLTTPGTLESFARLRQLAPPSAQLGVGTILTVEQAVGAADAGADYLVTPMTDPLIIGYAVNRRIPIYPGGLTPTELHRGWVRGATAVKLFPASTVGPDYIAQLRGPFPDIRVVPSGGIDLDSAADWLTAGATAVSVGGPLIGDALREGDLGELRKRVRRLRESVDMSVQRNVS